MWADRSEDISELAAAWVAAGATTRPTTVSTVVGHTADCGSDGLLVRDAVGRTYLVFATEVQR